jgi:hypothetical protein
MSIAVEQGKFLLTANKLSGHILLPFGNEHKPDALSISSGDNF